MTPGKQNIFITGAGGFIGRHLVEAAIQQGFEVFAMIRNPHGADHLRQAKVVFGDITDGRSLVKIFAHFAKEGIKIDYVVHAAGMTKPNARSTFFETNVEGTKNLIEAIRSQALNPKKIVFLSSLAACGCTVAGGTVNVADCQPISNYGKSKLQAEPLLINSGLPYVIIRPTAVYGPGEKDLLTVFRFIARGINPLLGNRPQELTFIYVADLVNLVLKAAESNIVNKIYFASDGKIYSRKDLTVAISKGLGKRPINLVVPLPLVKVIAYITQNMNALLGTTSQLNLDKYNELVAESWNCDIRSTVTDFGFKADDDLYSGARKTVNWYIENKWI